MATKIISVADRIRNQIGSSTLERLGAIDEVSGESWLRFRVRSQSTSHLIITYEHGLDLYSVRALKVNGECRDVSMIPASQLHAALYTSV